ncbi:MAG: pyridoxine 5'-phosphate synthase [Candidatus Margulisiibacteriota bacterium]|jgi:pyridoxine 5-phosphate synthase
MKLGVNIDHVATLRQVRLEKEPNLLLAAKEALDGGADGITIHLREDRRHIQDQDVFELKKIVPRLNLEMSTNQEIVEIACQVKPEFACLVPEKRAELTTEGGLNVIANAAKLETIIAQLNTSGIIVSVFIDPELDQIKKAKEVGAQFIEIHTGKFASEENEAEFEKIRTAMQYAHEIGLKINAGHGLKYQHISKIKTLNYIEELNIGHSIIARSIFVGLKKAVAEMKQLLQ